MFTAYFITLMNLKNFKNVVLGFNNLSHNIVFKFLCLLMINAQSIVKMGELTGLVNSFKPRMVAITKSCCKDFIGDAELYLQTKCIFSRSPAVGPMAK